MVPNPQGLSTAKAQEHLSRDGPNTIPARARNRLVHTIWEILKTPMFSLLVIAALLYFVIGSLEDALLLASFITLSRIRFLSNSPIAPNTEKIIRPLGVDVSIPY